MEKLTPEQTEKVNELHRLLSQRTEEINSCPENDDVFFNLTHKINELKKELGMK